MYQNRAKTSFSSRPTWYLLSTQSDIDQYKDCKLFELVAASVGFCLS